jgi:hypothetical protein
MSLKKISMNLTDKDISNTDKLKENLKARTKADTVSAALSIATTISEHVKDGDEFFMRSKDGKEQRVIITGMN